MEEIVQEAKPSVMPVNLTECVTCKQKVSVRAFQCVHCGEPMAHKTGTFGRILAVIFVLYAIASTLGMVLTFLYGSVSPLEFYLWLITMLLGIGVFDDY